MAIRLVGTPIYELKIINPNAIANYNGGQLVKAIGEDMSAYVGKPTQGLVVKESLAVKVIEQVKKDLVAGKVKEPVLRAGVSGKDVVFVVTDAKNSKYEQSCVLVASYVPLREKVKRETGTVVNLDPSDRAVTNNVATLSNATGAKHATKDDVDYGAIKGSGPLVLVAHGEEDRTDAGQLYGKDFAGKTPAAIVEMLTKSPEPKRRLSKSYSGTIYLNGCFTAQSSAMENYTKQVWELLKRSGFTKLSVKGNLGLASANSSGGMDVSPSAAWAEGERLTAKAKKQRGKIKDKREELLDDLWAKEFESRGDGAQAQFDADPRVVKIIADAKKAADKNRDELQKSLDKVPGYEIPDLVGQFGLPVISARGR